MIYLTLPELLHAAERVVGPDVSVRDYGLLESALARPRTDLFGTEAYQELAEKAAALLHSITRNHALVDDNKRLGLAADDRLPQHERVPAHAYQPGGLRPGDGCCIG